MENKRILVVDDAPQILQLLRQAFGSKSWQVKTADTGSAGLELACEEPFDLLVLDLQLPHLNGRELLQTLRKRGIATPAIMMSGMATPATGISLAKVGCKALFEKPFEMEVLLEAAEAAMSTGAPGAAGRVLIVEDHAALLALVTRVLGLAGFAVATAQSGDEALDWINSSQQPFDFALLDMHVPGLAGPQLVRAVAQRMPKTFVIVATGEASAEEIAEAYRQGCDVLIRKPFQVETLPAILAQLRHQANEKRKKVETKEEYDRLPIHRKAIVTARKIIKAPPLSKPKRVLRGVALGIFAVVLSLATLGIAAKIESAVVDQKGVFQQVLDKLEGYLERDESRELAREHQLR